jgi:uncharacterized protein YeeX (DUF496 family)
MKNLEQVKQAITELEQVNESFAKPSGVGLFGEITIVDNNTDTRRNQKRIEFLRLVEIYLEPDPTEEFCKSERIRLSTYLNNAEGAWQGEYNHRVKMSNGKFANIPQTRLTFHKNEYLKDLDLSTVRLQIKTLNYILS